MLFGNKQRPLSVSLNNRLQQLSRYRSCVMAQWLDENLNFYTSKLNSE